MATPWHFKPNAIVWRAQPDEGSQLIPLPIPQGVAVAGNIPAAEMIPGRRLAVAFFDDHDARGRW